MRRHTRVAAVDVVVVIPNWNGVDLLAAAIDSLLAQTHPATVVVVDNGSHDGSLELLRSRYADLPRVELPDNAGFAGGVNAGIAVALERAAGAVATFNNDAVADPGWLAHLVAELERDAAVGIATGKVLRMDGRHLDTTGECYATCGQPFPRGRNHPDDGSYDRGEEVFGASGCATLYRAEMLRQVGVFDERFFAYYEDLDLSFRARLAGWSVRYAPAAVVHHHVSATSGRLGSFTRYHAAKNFLLLYLKNMPGGLFWRYLRHFGPEAVAQLLVATSRRDGAYFRALGRVLRDAGAIRRDRRRVQASRTVSTAEIDRWLHKGSPPDIPALPGA